MNASLPTGVIYSKVVNILQIFFLIFVACLLLFIPTFILNVLPLEDLQANSLGANALGLSTQTMKLFMQGVFIFLAVLFLASAAGIYFINKGLSRLSETARVWQIILAIFSLFYFPIGTILYGISLYFMLFDSRTKTAFCKDKELINK